MARILIKTTTGNSIETARTIPPTSQPGKHSTVLQSSLLQSNEPVDSLSKNLACFVKLIDDCFSTTSSPRMEGTSLPAKLQRRSSKMFEKEHSCRGINSVYRRAILLAIESLHDYQSRSNIDLVRRHTQAILEDGVVVGHGAISRNLEQWNDALFLKVLKSIVRDGEVDLCAQISAELTAEYKRKRADSLLKQLDERIEAESTVSVSGIVSAPLTPTSVTSTSTPDFYSCSPLPVPLPLVIPDRYQFQQQSLSLSQGCQSWSDYGPAPALLPQNSVNHYHHHQGHHQPNWRAWKDAPKRPIEHDKWKFIPKNIFDKTVIVNPMDTH